MKCTFFEGLFMGGVMLLALSCRNDREQDAHPKAVPGNYPITSNKAIPDTLVKNDPKQPELTVCLDKVSGDGTHYIITFYREQDIFLQRTSRFREVDFVFESGVSCVTIEIPYGLYAIAVFNDTNHNDKLDTNALGMPAEAYGFSAVKGALLKVPLYKDCQFEFAPASNRCSISMRHTD
jgi:uncharacterized protein (DUF2141 family)